MALTSESESEQASVGRSATTGLQPHLLPTVKFKRNCRRPPGCTNTSVRNKSAFTCMQRGLAPQSLGCKRCPVLQWSGRHVIISRVNSVTAVGAPAVPEEGSVPWRNSFTRPSKPTSEAPPVQCDSCIGSGEVRCPGCEGAGKLHRGGYATKNNVSLVTPGCYPASSVCLFKVHRSSCSLLKTCAAS